MSLSVSSRPASPNSDTAIINGSLTGSLSPWANAGAGNAWAYNTNTALLTISSGDSKRLRQPFKAKSGSVYAYAFQLAISSVGLFTINMLFKKSNGGTVQTIAVDSTLADGTENYSGSVTANNNYDYVEFIVSENLP